MKIKLTILAALFVGLTTCVYGDVFTVVALPDSQYYSEYDPNIFSQQTQWIADNASGQNIVFATHLGNIVHGNDVSVAKWADANSAVDILDGVLPYSVCLGNEDFNDVNSIDKSMGFDKFIDCFGPDRYQGYSWYGSATRHQTSSYQIFTAGGITFLHLNLEFEPDDEVLLWAQSVIDNNPDLPVIVSTNSFLTDSGVLSDPNTGLASNGGNGQWMKMVKENDQVFMVLCGQFASNGGEALLVSQNSYGNDVYIMCSDYQNSTDQAGGWLRLLEFDTSGNDISVTTYSPKLDQYKTGASSQFNLSINFTSRLSGFSTRENISTVQAANIEVIEYDRDDTINSVDVNIPTGQSTADVSIIQPSVNPGITDWSRGDYFVQIGSRFNTAGINGVGIASVAETSRFPSNPIPYVDDARYHSVSVAGGAEGQLSVSVNKTSMSVGGLRYYGGDEGNVNVGFAYFPFSAGWIGAHCQVLGKSFPSKIWSVVGNGIVLGDNLTQYPFTTEDPNLVYKPDGDNSYSYSWNEVDADRGVFELTLPGIDSLSDGVLIACAGNDENNHVVATPHSDGSGWQIAIRDNDTSGNNSESDSFNIVYVPYETPGIAAGRVSGRGGIFNGTGNFQIKHLEWGVFALYIDGYTPEDGALFVTGELQWSTEDDIQNYRPEGDHWVIENRSLLYMSLTNATQAQFSFVFVPFDNSPTGPGASRAYKDTELLAANFEAEWDDANEVLNVWKTEGSYVYNPAFHKVGEYYQGINGHRIDKDNGINLGTIREFSRNDGDGSGDYLAVISSRNLNRFGINKPIAAYGYNKGHANFTGVWMPRGCGYPWGRLDSDGTLNPSLCEDANGMITASYMGTAGRYKCVFDNFTPDEGILFTLGQTGYAAMSCAMPLDDNSGWEVTTRLSISSATSYNAQYTSFAFFPYNSTGFNAVDVASINADGSINNSSGGITASKISTGTYRVMINDATPQDGGLLAEPYGGNSSTGAINAFMAYEPNDNDGSFTIKCFSLEADRHLVDSDFAIVFVPFEKVETYGDHVSGLWRDFDVTDVDQTAINSIQGLAFDPTSKKYGIYDRVYLVNSSTETHRGLYSVDIYNETYSDRLAMSGVSNQTDVAVDLSGTVYVAGIGTPYVYKVENPSSASPTETQMVGDYGGTGDDDIECIAMVPAGFGGSYNAGSDLLLFDKDLNNDGNNVVLSVLDKDSTLANPDSSAIWQDDSRERRIRGDASDYDGYAYLVETTLPTADSNGVTLAYVNRTKSDGTLERIFLDIDADDVSKLDDAIAINPADGSLWLNIDDDGVRNVFRVDVANAVSQGGGDYLAEITLEIRDWGVAGADNLGKNGLAFSPDGKLLALGIDAGIDKIQVYNVVTETESQIAGIIESFEDADDGYVLIAAHRGNHKYYPENSIDAMLSAVDLGAQIVEMDIQRTKDNVFVLMHDTTIDRTTNASGTVAELTYAELQNYYLKYTNGIISDIKIPALQDVMIALKGKCLMMLDKSNDYFEECADLARSCGVANQVILKSSKSDAEMVAVLNDNPDVYYGAGTISQAGYESKLQTLSLEMISIGYDSESSWLISSAAQTLADQYDVRVWNNSLNDTPDNSAGHIDSLALVDPDAHWGWQINHGIDIIQTDETEALKDYLCSIGKSYFDGLTDMSDLASFCQAWLAADSDVNYDCQWDFDKDDIINFYDFSSFASYWLEE